MFRASLVLALAGALTACGSSAPAGKYATGTFSESTPSPCLTAPIQSPAGNPACTVLEDLTDGGSTTSVMIPSCAESGNTGPCWALTTGTAGCSGMTFILNAGTAVPPGAIFSYSCLLCSSGGPAAGC